jgi:hypothetical protein
LSQAFYTTQAQVFKLSHTRVCKVRVRAGSRRGIEGEIKSEREGGKGRHRVRDIGGQREG